MSFFISTYQQRLDCSEDEAYWRVFWTCFFIVLASVTVIVPALLFPKTGSYQKEISLPSGNYTLVDKVNDGDVTVNWEKFSSISKNQQIFVAEEDDWVNRYVKVGGVGYRYELNANHKFFYSVSKTTLAGNTLTLTLGRNWDNLILCLIFMPFLALCVSAIGFSLATFKTHGSRWNPIYRSVFSSRKY